MYWKSAENLGRDFKTPRLSSRARRGAERIGAPGIRIAFAVATGAQGRRTRAHVVGEERRAAEAAVKSIVCSFARPSVRTFVRSFAAATATASLCVARDPAALRDGGRRTAGRSVPHPKSRTVRPGATPLPPPRSLPPSPPPLFLPLAFPPSACRPSRRYPLPFRARSSPRECARPRPRRSRASLLSNLARIRPLVIREREIPFW